MLTFWLLDGWTLPPERPCLRQGPSCGGGGPVGSTLPEFPSGASVPTGQGALMESPFLQPLGAQAPVDTRV